MIFLNKLAGTRISTQLITISLRNLSISSNPQTTNNAFLFGKFDNQDFRLKPLIAKQNTNLVKDIGITCPLWRRKEIFELPLTNKIIENPTQSNKVIEEIINVDKTISLPDNNNSEDDIGKQAKNGMIMIRHRKMKKHKLRKLRKKMKYEWAKVRQRRELRKEKVFQAELTAEIREAESFSAEAYVAEKIRQATESPIPRFWKGKRLPQFIIKEKLEKEEMKKTRQKYALWEKLRTQ